MSEKKNLDKLFKEQFKDFEVAPNDYVWENIERELHKDKRKRRIIPIWWQIGGVAAILALLFTVGNLAINTIGSDPFQEQTVETENQSKEDSDYKESMQSNELTHPINENRSESQKNTSIANEDAFSEEQNNELPEDEDQLTKAQKNTNINNTVVTNNKNDSQRELKTSNLNKNSSQTETVVANTNTKSSTIEKNKTNETVTSTEISNTVANSSEEIKSKSKASENDLKKEQSEIDKLIKATKQSKETQVATSAVSEENVTTTEIDSSAANSLIKEENALEKAIAEANKEEEEKEDEEQPSKRWSVAPNIAPVYFNTLGKGSSLDNQFIENTKEGDVSMSYGLKGSYAINSKLKIRAGINKVDLGYSTNNILVFDDINPNSGARQMQNVNTNNTEANSTYFSASALSISNGPEIFNAKERASIDQQLGFIEVPVELEYSLVDKKFGLNLIGGFSTLFLNNNEVYSVENNGNRTLMGEATNIKDMSYSANFGVGVNYNVSEQLRFNLEPTFKYQINTFNNTSGDFQPFFIGVYTGLSFKF